MLNGTISNFRSLKMFTDMKYMPQSEFSYLVLVDHAVHNVVSVTIYNQCFYLVWLECSYWVFNSFGHFNNSVYLAMSYLLCFC